MYKRSVLVLWTMFSSHLGLATDIHDFVRRGESEVLASYISSVSTRNPKELNEQNEDGETPLHIAVIHQPVEITRLLIANGANVNARDKHGKTPLHNAQAKHMVPLLENGADIEARDNYGNTPLQSMSIWLRTPECLLLMHRGASVATKDNHGCTLLHSITMHHVKQEEGQCALAKEFLARGADVNAGAMVQDTPLHEAAKYGNTSYARFLLENGALVDAPGFFQKTSLHNAAEAGHVLTAALLLEYHADMQQRNRDGQTPLHLAVIKGHEPLTEYLLERADPADTQLLLHDIIVDGKNKINILRMLLRKGANPNVKRDEGKFRALNSRFGGATPLHVVAFQNLYNGNCFATPEECQTMGTLLLEHDADPNIPDFEGHPPLHYAVETNQVSLAQALLEHGARVDEGTLMGQTALHLAVWSHNRSRSVGFTEEERLPLVQLLLERGANPNAQIIQGGYCGRTPLLGAVLSNFAKISALLIRYGANATLPDFSGSTPLQTAEARKCEPLIQLLRENGGDQA
ncbi:ankyrin repeat domain-containing protein [Candidatus Babeliales bacterium]|nr:ankyrin repeat domain-containing protein [Candidatus Babeliales bacterium]